MNWQPTHGKKDINKINKSAFKDLKNVFKAVFKKHKEPSKT